MLNTIIFIAGGLDWCNKYAKTVYRGPAYLHALQQGYLTIPATEHFKIKMLYYNWYCIFVYDLKQQ